jgi:hypothetical protein
MSDTVSSASQTVNTQLTDLLECRIMHLQSMLSFMVWFLFIYSMFSIIIVPPHRYVYEYFCNAQDPNTDVTQQDSK